MQTDIQLKEKYATFRSVLGEKELRCALAAEAKSMGRGGLSKVSKLSGVSRTTLNAGLKDLASITVPLVSGSRSRRSGGGRKKAVEKDVNLLQAIENIVSPHTMGDPMKPLQWTSKSLRKIVAQLKAEGFDVSHKLVGVLLKSLGYSLQSGNIQITSLSIKPDVEIPEITPLLIETINRGIKKTSDSLKHNVLMLQQKMQIQ